MESITAPSSESRSPWAYLSPELLADVCARLHDATDFVRFHAVCQPWRDARPSQLSPLETRSPKTFQPWLLSQRIGRIINSHVIYSARSGRRGSNNGIVLVEPAVSSAGGERNWVASADGRFAWLFVGGSEPALFNLVTGEAKPLPPFPDQDDDNGIGRRLMNPRGIVYADGTIFLYSFDTESTREYYYCYRYNPGITAAILRPGDTVWTAMEITLTMPTTHHACAAFHDDKVLVWVSVFFWCILTPNFGFGGNGGNNAGFYLKTTWDKLEEESYERDQCYILESRGELLWASVLVKHKGPDDYAEGNIAPKLAVRVHALEQEVDGSDKMRWVERDGRGLDDRVMFLGSPASFAVDATELGLDGGCVYFVYKHRVFRYNLIDGKANPVEWLSSAGRGSDKAHVWLRPQPLVASIQEIRESLDTRNKK